MKKLTLKEKREHSIKLRKECNEIINDIGKNFRESPEKIAEYVAFSSRFYKYSVRNMKLIYSQNNAATFIQSFTAWKKQGYSVRSGEKGIRIFAPRQRVYLENPDKPGDYSLPLSDATKEQKDLFHAGKINAHFKTEFAIENVFDITQTTFPKEKYPELYTVGYPSELHDKICQGLVKFSETELGVEVRYEDLKGIALRGFYSPIRNQIKVNSILNDTQKLSTLTHEIGHALEHHGSKTVSGAQKEFEADIIPVMLQSNYHLEITDTRKSHLADNYREFENEIKVQNPEMTDEQIQEKMDEALGNSMDVFSKAIDKIDEYVEKFIPREQIQKMQKNLTKDIDRENVQEKEIKSAKKIRNMKNLEKENEMEY